MEFIFISYLKEYVIMCMSSVHGCNGIWWWLHVHVTSLSILQTSNSPDGSVRISMTWCLSFLLHQAKHFPHPCPHSHWVTLIIIVRYLATCLWVCLVYHWKCKYEWVYKLLLNLYFMSWNSVRGIVVTYTDVVGEVCKWLEICQLVSVSVHKHLLMVVLRGEGVCVYVQVLKKVGRKFFSV